MRKQGDTYTGQMGDGAMLLRENSIHPNTLPLPTLTLLHPHRYNEDRKETVRANSMEIDAHGVKQLYQFLKTYYEA